MPRASELRRGHALTQDGDVFVVVETERVVRGRKSAKFQMKLRNLKTGQLIEQRFRPDEEVQIAYLEKKQMEYLYSDGSGHVLMDLQTYDQITVDDQVMGDGTQYLNPNTVVEVVTYTGKIVGLELPNTVDLKVVDTPPVIKGATVTSQSKDATLETGVRVKVPGFIEPGEMIRVDTRTGQYVERVKSE